MMPEGQRQDPPQGGDITSSPHSSRHPSPSPGTGIKCPSFIRPVIPVIPCRHRGCRAAPSSTGMGMLGTPTPSEGDFASGYGQDECSDVVSIPPLPWWGPSCGAAVPTVPTAVPARLCPTRPSPGARPSRRAACSLPRCNTPLPAACVTRRCQHEERGQPPAHGPAWHPPCLRPLPGSWLTRHAAAGAEDRRRGSHGIAASQASVSVVSAGK